MAPEVRDTHLFAYTALVAAFWFTVSGIYYARDLLIPVVAAALVAVLLVPICNWLERHMSRTIAAIICVTAGVAIIALLLLWFIFFQVTAFYYDIPRMYGALQSYGVQIKEWVNRYTDVTLGNHINLIAEWASWTVETATRTVVSISRSILYSTALCLIFIFYVLFLLMYRGRFLDFALTVVSEHHTQRMQNVLFQVQETISQYLRGVFTIIVILALYNMCMLHLLAVPYATLWAIVSAILYIIPYIGIMIGSVFPIASALLLQQAPITALLVVAVYIINQIIENYILTPYIVGGHVQINPLFVLLAFFAGGQLWGVAGMILFLPLLSIVKIVCDHIPALHPYGYVLGTQQQSQT